MSISPRHWLASIVTMIVATAVAVGTTGDQVPTSARLVEGRVAPEIPQAYGGGEVVLELMIDSEGSVSAVERVRMTPPFLDYVVKSVTQWRFAPATVVIDGRVTPIAAPVLVVAVFRPPLVYAGPAPGPRPQVFGALSRRVPSLASLTLPPYPPLAIGDGVVVVEIEMHRGEPRSYRIVGPTSGFDAAALDGVRTWRFGPPQDSDLPETMFAYAVLGFRSPLTLPAPPR